MRYFIRLLVVLSTIAIYSPSISTAAPPTLSGSLAALAASAVATLAETHYSIAEHINPSAGLYDCDCNEFVGFLLEQLAPDQYAQLPKEPNHRRPRAFEYYDFIHPLAPDSTSGWQQIIGLSNCQAGDIICWRTAEIEKGHDTGHVLIVAQSPILLSPGIYSVRVYDSTASPHLDDTRGSGDRPFVNGVGCGNILFQVDATDQPIGFQFTDHSHFVYRAIAIGRLQPIP